MRRGGKVQIAAVGLLGAIVLVHCLWILTLALRVVRVLAERARSNAPGLWWDLVGAAAIGVGVWLTLGLLGLSVLAVWFRVQRTRP